MSRFAVCACAMAVAVACPVAAAAPSAPAKAAAVTDEQAIRQANARWLELIRAKDAAAIASSIYAPGGALMPPNSPAAIGTSAVQQGWQGMFDTPGFALTFEPQEIVVSSSGDMAYDRGTYRFSATPESGAITDSGKYVVVWRKIGGQWRAVADIFNSNSPAS